MNTVCSALLVHNQPEVFRGLENMLRERALRICRARHFAEARTQLRQAGRIDLILTDIEMVDGTWRDVIRLARESTPETPVIVISRVVNMQLYLDTQEAGAADFIVPPIAERDLTHVLTAAMFRTVAPAIAYPRPVVLGKTGRPRAYATRSAHAR